MLKDFVQFFIARCEAINRICQWNGIAVFGVSPLQFLYDIFFEACVLGFALIATYGLALYFDFNDITVFIFALTVLYAVYKVILPLFLYIIFLPFSFFGRLVVGNDEKILSRIRIITIFSYAISFFVFSYMTGALDAYVFSFSLEDWISNFNSVFGALLSLVIIGIIVCMFFFILINILALSVIYWDLTTFFGHTSDEFPYARNFFESSVVNPGEQLDHEELFILANIEANWSGIVVCSYFSIMAILFWLMVVTQKTVNFFKDRD